MDILSRASIEPPFNDVERAALAVFDKVDEAVSALVVRGEAGESCEVEAFDADYPDDGKSLGRFRVRPSGTVEGLVG